MFWAYKYNDWSLWEQIGEPDWEVTQLLCDSVRNHRNTASFTELERDFWRHIDGKYAHADESGEIIPDILVMRGDDCCKIRDMFRTHPSYTQLIEHVKQVYGVLEGIFKKYSHQVLHDNLGYNIRMELYAMRMMSVRDLVGDGMLVPPADPTTSTLGMHLILK